MRTVSGNVVELTCHPGLLDATLIGRDCTADDGMMQRRVRELELLADPRLAEACRSAGFTVLRPSQLAALYRGGRDVATPGKGSGEPSDAVVAGAGTRKRVEGNGAHPT